MLVAGQTITSVPPFDDLPIPAQLIRDLRSDHAGEVGAVQIYKGLLMVARHDEVIEFAKHHLVTEERHLAFFETWLPKRFRSRLLPFWRLAATGLGLVAGLLGRRWTYLTIDAVETFVVAHYQEQIASLPTKDPGLNALRSTLIQFQSDESDHREDANRRTSAESRQLERWWQMLIGSGSRIAVKLARRI